MERVSSITHMPEKCGDSWDVGFTVEYCPYCDTEQVIFDSGVTACPNCGKPLAPCSVCETCNYNTCPYGCDGTDNDENKAVTRPKISRELSQKLYQIV